MSEMTYRVEGRCLLRATECREGFLLFGEQDIFIGYLKNVCDELFYLENHKKEALTRGEESAIRYFLNKLNSNLLTPRDLGSYVYAVYVDSELKYIGKGNGERWKHTISGTSHVKELNRALFSGSLVETVLVKAGMTDSEAFGLESELIESFSRYDLYNTRGVCSTSKYCEIDPDTLKKQSTLLASVRE